MANNSYPKLIVCDLDQGLLGNRDAETELLETWLARRPLLLFHSEMSLEQLRDALVATSLPPADFLAGAGTSILVRFTLGRQACSDASLTSDCWSDFDPEQLLTIVATRALSELELSRSDEMSEFPRVENANLTASGLLVTFEPSGTLRRHSVSIALSWLLKHLKLDASEVRTHTPCMPVQTPVRTSGNGLTTYFN